MIAVFDDFNTDTWVFRRHCEDIQHLYPCVSEWQCTDDEEALQSEVLMKISSVNYPITTFLVLFFLKLEPMIFNRHVYPILSFPSVCIVQLCATRAYDQGSQMYLDGLYFGFTTMATIGYGDINAFTQNERITCIIIMLTAVSFYRYVKYSLCYMTTMHWTTDHFAVLICLIPTVSQYRLSLRF